MATADPVVAPVEAIKNLQLTEKMTGAEYWAQYLRSHMEPLLEAVGSYTPEEQAAQMRFLVDHVAPSLGPLPTEPHRQYTMTYVDSPFEPSLNLTSAGKAKVRYEFEVVKPASEEEDPFGENVARELLPRLAEAVGADTQWLKSLMDTFFLTRPEADALRGKLPSFMPCAMMAFDCDGSKTMMKVYIPAIRKAIASGQSSNEFILNAVKGLEPLGSQLGPGLDIVKDYLASCKHDAMLIFVGIDCVDPLTNKGARVKVYLHTSSNSFAVARDVMTLGGRLTDETSLKRVEVLRSIWPLLRNEQPGQGPDPEATAAEDKEAYDAWEKPERVTGTPFSGLQYNVELSPGKAGLETKCYVPLFQHNANAEEADASMEKVLKKLGHDWGNGKYRETVKSVFGKDRVSPTFVSFSYSKTKGAYMSAYIPKVIENVGSEIKPGNFEYF